MDIVIDAVDECVAMGATVEWSPGLYRDDESLLKWAGRHA
jgi:hypothetical protein